MGGGRGVPALREGQDRHKIRKKKERERNDDAISWTQAQPSTKGNDKRHESKPSLSGNDEDKAKGGSSCKQRGDASRFDCVWISNQGLEPLSVYEMISEATISLKDEVPALITCRGVASSRLRYRGRTQDRRLVEESKKAKRPPITMTHLAPGRKQPPPTPTPTMPMPLLLPLPLLWVVAFVVTRGLAEARLKQGT
ncbi:hypothetical protein B0F90DRAFT_1670719 [Multifurca ochricompacta]|uniref:Uncharacterized protein n=1 Tax=Multifurca ochricompacta TaxID=376703 RepID=A0AAD4LXN1_9AGAM|nr:hypothetical protein B0F90DRAFT_1670719 [Multifurca ochricompacta]